MARLLMLVLLAAAFGLGSAGAAKAGEAPVSAPDKAASSPAPWPAMDDADFDVTEMLC